MAVTLSQLLIDAETAKKELNEAMLTDSLSGMEKAKKVMDKAIKEYNELAVVLDYKTLRSKSSPMLAAIEQLSVATIESKRNEDRETGIVTYSIESSSKQISLVAFDDFCGRDKVVVAPDRLWMHKVDRFCLLVTYRVMKDLGKDTRKLEETYYISDVARQIDLGKTPTSNTQMLKQLQSIVNSIIASDDDVGYKVTSHDVEYIVKTMTRRGRESGTVVTPKPATMHTLLMDVLHRIVTDSEYKVEYVTKNKLKKKLLRLQVTLAIMSLKLLDKNNKSLIEP